MPKVIQPDYFGNPRKLSYHQAKILKTCTKRRSPLIEVLFGKTETESITIRKMFDEVKRKILHRTRLSTSETN